MAASEQEYNLVKLQNNLRNNNIYLDNYPHQIHFLLIDRCNSKCIMCGGDYFRSRTGRMITLDKFKKMALNLRLENSGGIVLAGAGDPLLNKDLVEIIRFVNSEYPHLLVALTTNGIALSEKLSASLLELNVDSVNISINSATRETFKRVMQVDCFDRVRENARNFVAMRERAGKRTVLQFSSAINRLNIEDLPTLVELTREVRGNSINIMYCRFYPKHIRDLNIESPEYRLENGDSLFYHQELSDEMVENAKKLAQRHNIGFTHEPLFKDKTLPGACIWPVTSMMVGFDGEIYPCGGSEVHFREKVEKGTYNFGNALLHPIESFWNGEAYRALRLSSKQGESCLVEECRCCANIMSANDKRSHIMEWDNKTAEKTVAVPPQTTEISGRGKKEPSPLRQDTPLVSVIVPTHNRPEMLVHTIRSILNQTYGNIEIILVNDAGTDVENIVAYLNKKGIITYVRHGDNRGLAAARNTGISLSRGKYIAYLDDDDLFYEDHVETLVNFLETNDYKVAYTDAYRAFQTKQNGGYVVTKRDLPYSFDFDYDRIMMENFIPVLCVMHHRDCLKEVGLFDPVLKRTEDWDLWMRISRRFKFGHIRKVTCEFSWREDGGTMTKSDVEAWAWAGINIIYKYKDFAARNSKIRDIHSRIVNNYMNMLKGALYKGIQSNIKDVYRRFLAGNPDQIVERLIFLEGQYEGLGSPIRELMALVSLQKPDVEQAVHHLKEALRFNPSNDFARQMLEALSPEPPAPAAAKKEVDFSRTLTSIVIPMKNQWGYTKLCLDSIVRYTDIPFELIVVDNGSETSAMDRLKKWRGNNPKVGLKYVRSEKNLGFAKGCNEGIKLTRGDFVVILNNDTLVTPGWLAGLLKPLAIDEGVGITGPMSNFVSGSQMVDNSPLHFPDPDKVDFGRLAAYSGEFRNSYKETYGETDCIIGLCMAMRRGMIETIGGFDGRFYPGNFEDDDFSIRTRLAGYKLLICRDTFIYHFGSRTFANERIDYNNALKENLKKFAEKWGVPIVDCRTKEDVYRAIFSKASTFPAENLYSSLHNDNQLLVHEFHDKSAGPLLRFYTKTPSISELPMVIACNGNSPEEVQKRMEEIMEQESIEDTGEITLYQGRISDILKEAEGKKYLLYLWAQEVNHKGLSDEILVCV
jgi:GT2 family glycosyltransferase/MoaA/NifB/PqqE/SkfB family radical SAM enzyme